ncbi:MAG: hypothetical protein KY464_02025 [Gemmatimonadetes bacterium]|nr:hypothetical protein [Gemmatimonadota bacterium]
MTIDTRPTSEIRAELEDVEVRCDRYRDDLAASQGELDALSGSRSRAGVEEMVDVQNRTSALKQLLSGAEARVAELRAALANAEAEEDRKAGLDYSAEAATAATALVAEWQEDRTELATTVNVFMERQLARRDRLVDLQSRFASLEPAQRNAVMRELEARGIDLSGIRTQILTPELPWGLDAQWAMYLQWRDQQRMKARYG